MDYLLGRVMCCDTAEQLRGHRTAITDEGMLYQGYVARALRRDRMERMRSSAVSCGHFAYLSSGRGSCRSAGNISHRKPIWQAVSQQKTPMLTPYYVRNIVPQRQADFLYRAELEERRSTRSTSRFPSRPAVAGSAEAADRRDQRQIAALSRQREVQIAHKAKLEERIRQLDEGNPA